jgi:DNA-binding CsgD family transcriptional regulator
LPLVFTPPAPKCVSYAINNAVLQMTFTVLTDFSNLILSIYRAAQELPVHQFQDAILASVKRTLPFDSSMWGTATLNETGIDIHSIHLHNLDAQFLEAYEKVKHQDSAAAGLMTQLRATIGFDAEQEFTGADQAEMRAFSKSFGHQHCFITSDFNPTTRFTHWVSLFRADSTMPCMQHEIEFLENLAPHIMQALAINRLVHLDRLTGDVARETWCVAIADRRGVLYHADDRFRLLMNLEWPGRADRDKLPAKLLELLHTGDDHVSGKHVVVKRSLEKDILFLKARDRMPVDDITPRELLVARLLASGLTHKEVAQRLERSPDTISSQAKTVFDKLGINNVAMLSRSIMLRD